MAQEKGITVKKEDDMPEWYSQVILKSELADYSPIKGCMVIRPSGYSIWQNIVDYFNSRLSKLKVKNVYFPLFIPESFFKKEAEHAKGFSPEVAWVESKDADQERFAIRPTSETIMYDSYAKWIRSWRDLPLRLNQWCNIVRWEVSDVKLFLRTREILWQEGHCVYQTKEECDNETLLILDEYAKLCEELLAIPVIKGIKTEKEKFAGALYTATMESFMPDGKALQMGTSHNLGQGFAKVFGIEYIGKDEKKHLPWQNSWGFTTRLIGGMVMLHSDNKGLVIPPKVAENKAVIVPIIFDKSKAETLKQCEAIRKELTEFDVILDDREGYTSGWKYNDWEVRGIPVRIEVGPKDIEKDQAVLVRRDTGEKIFVKRAELKKKLDETLQDIQKSLFVKAKKLLDSNIVEVDNFEDFKKQIEKRKLVKTHFCGDEDKENEIKAATQATSRCIPLKENPKNEDDVETSSKKCFYTGKPAKYVVYFAKNY